MTDEGPAVAPATWWENSGLFHIFRVAGMALQPAKMGLALMAIAATFTVGSTLDWAWSLHGGVNSQAIDRFIVAAELDKPYEELEGDSGIFETWRAHGQRCVFGFMGSSVPGASVAAGTPLGNYFEKHSRVRPLRHLAGLGYGAFWMFKEHTLFFLVFGLTSLLIWALAGGAICRLAAVQIARDEKPTMVQSLRYAREHLFTGFVMAPCIPLLFALVIGVGMALAGMVLRIPVLGDLLGGVLFALAMLGGFVLTTLLVGLLAGGSLMWPAVAAEGQDAYDAFARSLSYAFTKPWKTLIYAIIATIFASICWVFVNLFTYISLAVTRAIAGAGTAWFGLWTSGTEGAPASKLELIWPMSGPSNLYSWPHWSELGWNECIAAVFVGIMVLLVVALMFSFLASFYYSASTVLYFLLRRDVDNTDLEEVYMDDYVGPEMESLGPADRVGGDVAVPPPNDK